MDNSHVALVAVKLEKDGFQRYRCDRPMPLGVNLGSLTKVLKCAKDDDMVTLKATDNGDILNLIYEAKSMPCFNLSSSSQVFNACSLTDSDRVAEYDMKLMDIDTDALGIPDTEYDATVTMPANEFARICRDLSQLGESVRIEVSKEGVRFASDGEAANGNVLLKQTEAARQRYAGWGPTDKEDEAEGSKKKEKKIKKERIKKEEGDEEDEKDGDEDVEEDDGGSYKAPESDGEEEAEPASDAEEDEDSNKKKRKRAATSNGKRTAKKAKKSADEDGDTGGGVAIEMAQSVSLTFSLKYLVNFAKSASLVDTVVLKLSSEVPLLVSPPFFLHFLLLTFRKRWLITSAKGPFCIILHLRLGMSDFLSF